MGCTQSKIDNEESVSRCKDRRNLIKEAVTARNAFASAHSGYTISLKHTGAALSDYAQGEAPPPPSASTIEPTSEPFRPPPPPIIQESSFPLPPPPLPSFSPSPLPPLQRAMTMPEFSSSSKPSKMKMMGIDENEDEEEEEEGGGNDSLRPRIRRRNRAEEIARETPLSTPNPPPPPPESKGMAWDYFFTMDNIPGLGLDQGEEEEEEEEDYIVEEKTGSESEGFHNVGGNESGNEFKTPEKPGFDRGLETEEEMTPVVLKERQFLHSITAPAGLRGESGVEVVSNGVDLLKIFNDVDDHFLKASESAQDVSKMLEATRLHYHSNFADNRGE